MIPISCKMAGQKAMRHETLATQGALP